MQPRKTFLRLQNVHFNTTTFTRGNIPHSLFYLWSKSNNVNCHLVWVGGRPFYGLLFFLYFCQKNSRICNLKSFLEFDVGLMLNNRQCKGKRSLHDRFFDFLCLFPELFEFQLFFQYHCYFVVSCVVIFLFISYLIKCVFYFFVWKKS